MDFHLSPLYNKALQEQHLYPRCGLFRWSIKHLVPYRKRSWNILSILLLSFSKKINLPESTWIFLDQITRIFKESHPLHWISLFLMMNNFQNIPRDFCCQNPLAHCDKFSFLKSDWMISVLLYLNDTFCFSASLLLHDNCKGII